MPYYILPLRTSLLISYIVCSLVIIKLISFLVFIKAAIGFKYIYIYL